MKKFIISYITMSGALVLNNVVDSSTMGEALFELREAEEVKVILSIVSY